jgi:GTP cyclohydrolase III
MPFLAIDGDNIGSRVEKLVIMEQAEKLSLYATEVSQRLQYLGQCFNELGGTLVFIGGDSILVNFARSEIEKIKSVLIEPHPVRFSAGWGSTMREAYIALKVAKSSGKNCWVDYEHIDQVIGLTPLIGGNQ